MKALGQPGLLDLLVQPAPEVVGMEEVEDLRPSKRKVIYSEVLPITSVYSPTNVESVTIIFRSGWLYVVLQPFHLIFYSECAPCLRLGNMGYLSA